MHERVVTNRRRLTSYLSFGVYQTLICLTLLHPSNKLFVGASWKLLCRNSNTTNINTQPSAIILVRSVYHIFPGCLAISVVLQRADIMCATIRIREGRHDDGWASVVKTSSSLSPCRLLTMLLDAGWCWCWFVCFRWTHFKRHRRIALLHLSLISGCGAKNITQHDTLHHHSMQTHFHPAPSVRHPVHCKK